MNYLALAKAVGTVLGIGLGFALFITLLHFYPMAILVGMMIAGVVAFFIGLGQIFYDFYKSESERENEQV